MYNSLAIVENIAVELGQACAGKLFIIQIVLFMLFFIHREEGDGVHNSLAIVENILEFRPGVSQEAF